MPSESGSRHRTELGFSLVFSDLGLQISDLLCSKVPDCSNLAQCLIHRVTGRYSIIVLCLLKRQDHTEKQSKTHSDIVSPGKEPLYASVFPKC